MKSVLPLLALAVLAGGCSTAYKSGQTPDDVYFSPERPQEEYVQVNKEGDRQYRGQPRRNEAAYDNGYGYSDDRYLRMKVRNRRLWSDLDFYYNDPYAYRPYNNIYLNTYWGTTSYWNPYTFWNYNYNPYFYNPYYNKVIVLNPRNPVYNRPRTMNLNVFSSPQQPNTPKRNYRGNGSYYGSNDSYNRPRRDVGRDTRDLFRGSNNNVSPSRPSASPSTGSGSSNSGSRGSGGNAPARRF